MEPKNLHLQQLPQIILRLVLSRSPSKNQCTCLKNHLSPLNLQKPHCYGAQVGAGEEDLESDTAGVECWLCHILHDPWASYVTPGLPVPHL